MIQETTTHHIEIPIELEIEVRTKHQPANTTYGHPDDYYPEEHSEEREICGAWIHGKPIDWTRPEWARVLPILQREVNEAHL